MSITFSQLINQSFISLGAVKPGATTPANAEADAFLRLNQLWEGWGIEETLTNAQYHQSLTLTAGTSVYTFGTGGTLVATALPIRIYGAESVSGNFRNPVKVVSFKDFDEQVRDPQASTAVLASVLAADNANPSINLRVFPVPATAPGSLLLDYWGVMTAFATVGTTVALAPAYTDALQWNLAMAIAPIYVRQGPDGKAIMDLVAANAASSLARIQNLSQSINGSGAPAQGG